MGGGKPLECYLSADQRRGPVISADLLGFATMPEPTTTAASVSTPGGDALRLVLFGMPDAGKSSLLGALAEAAQTQEHLLNGHLTDPTKGLAELERRLYEDQPRETLEEVAPYPVVFEPFVPYEQGSDPRSEAI